MTTRQNADELVREVEAVLSQDPDLRAGMTPDGAYANCFAASARLADGLRDRGVRCGLLRVTGARADMAGAAGRWPWVPPAGMAHWVVRVGDRAVCVTARQFDRDAPVPLIEPLEDLAGRWERVESWACEDCPRLWVDDRHVEMAPPELVVEHREASRASAGRGPFPDPRHLDSAELAPVPGHELIEVRPGDEH